MASSYQVNLAIEIPIITENYINWHVFTCRNWVSAMLRHVVGKFFFDWPDYCFDSGGFGANRDVFGKLGIKLAIFGCYMHFYCIMCMRAYVRMSRRI